MMVSFWKRPFQKPPQSAEDKEREIRARERDERLRRIEAEQARIRDFASALAETAPVERRR